MIIHVKLITGEALNFKVDKPSCVIGRSGQCDVVIPHESISRKHCQIDCNDGELFVTDLGSINGIILDGQKITPNKAVKFQSFFTLSFGAVQSLNVEIDDERTSVQQNPMMQTSLHSAKPKPQRTASVPKPESGLPNKGTQNATEKKAEVPMTNFIILCVMVVMAFAYFVFQDEISGILQ